MKKYVYFFGKGKADGNESMKNLLGGKGANIIFADAVNLPLISAKERGAGGGHIRFNMAKSSMNSHLSQFPVGTYKKAHRHGADFHVFAVTGHGYSLLWYEGQKDFERVDWQHGGWVPYLGLT